jgi:hypothetical protein
MQRIIKRASSPALDDFNLTRRAENEKKDYSCMIPIGTG